MAPIAQTQAIRDPDRQLPQHQAAITLLQARLSAPDQWVKWLDLGCGRGQIISSLDSNLSAPARSHLGYWGYDLSETNARQTRKIAERLGLAHQEVKVGNLCDFNKLFDKDDRFDFITLTNTVHEVAPRQLSVIIVDSICRLSEKGSLFFYDMESVRTPELGSVLWSRDEIRIMMRVVLDELGASGYNPEIGQWHHTSCIAWNLQLHREYIYNPDVESVKDRAIDMLTESINKLLRVKLSISHNSLKSLKECGAETAEEHDKKDQLLHAFWAIYCALEDAQ